MFRAALAITLSAIAALAMGACGTSSEESTRKTESADLGEGMCRYQGVDRGWGGGSVCQGRFDELLEDRCLIGTGCPGVTQGCTQGGGGVNDCACVDEGESCSATGFAQM